jgi:hypothetical protein
MLHKDCDTIIHGVSLSLKLRRLYKVLIHESRSGTWLKQPSNIIYSGISGFNRLMVIEILMGDTQWCI